MKCLGICEAGNTKSTQSNERYLDGTVAKRLNITASTVLVAVIIKQNFAR